MIKVNFDMSQGWTFESTEESPEMVDVSFSDGNSPRIDATGLSFGIEKFADGSSTFSDFWPPENTSWKEVTPDHAFHYLCYRRGEIRFSVWAENNGVRSEAEYAYTWEPDPVPYPSWIWDGSFWKAPVDYPDDGYAYRWSETAMSWVQYPDDGNAYKWDSTTEQWVAVPGE